MSNIDEVQSIGESIQNTFNNISYVLRNIPGLPKNLEEEFTDIKKDVAKVQAIANRQKNRANLSQTQINQDAQTIMRLNARVRQSDDDLRLMTIAYYNEKNVRRRWYFSYKDKHRRVGELLREKLFYRKLFQINRDDRRVLKFKLDTLKKAENKRLMQKHLSEWDYKTREAKGLTIKIPMPNSPDFSSSFHSDSSDTGSLTGGMRQKFDTIHRHSRRTSDILGDIEEELHSSDNENSGNSSSSIIIEGTSNTDIPPLFNDSNSSSSDDSEIRSSSSDDDIHARCMVGYELKKFHGSPTEDPEEHIEEFRLWLVGSGIDVGAGHANRINAHGVFIASLKGDAKDWYERTIHGKNWELRNLLDNTAQANLAAVQGRNAGQIGVQALNRANGQNARLAGIDERQIRLQFIRGLSPANQIEVRRLGLEKSVDNLLPNLEEIERYTAEQLSGAYLHPISDLTSTKKSVTNYYGNKDNVSVNPGMSKSEIENLIKSMISSSEPQETQVSKKTSPTIPPKNMEEIKAALLLKELYNMGFRDEPIVDFIESYNKRGEYFKRKQAQNDDSDDELANRMSKLSINKAMSKGYAQGVKTGIRASNKSSHRCSNCNRTGHNSRNCPRKKKKSKRKAK
ncbi:15975_t:CDS:2 [Entrophospora sp. SA101]|nr:15975_t:CDS:2 [Entrophospora sp. SA101]